MPKAKFKHLIFILLPLTFIGAIGCSGPEEKKASKLKQAESLRADGNGQAALGILEALASDYPNDPAILQQIGHIFDEQGDATMAAFFLEQAHQLEPGNVELLYQTYRAVNAADQPAGVLLEKLAAQAPDSMTPDLWVNLGQHYAKANQTQPALDAYLKGVNPDSAKPSAETAVAIGQLFTQLDNSAQAERWLSMAAENDSPDALTALFGLLEIKLSQKDWEASEALMSRLDKQFPGAVDASQWSSARSELKRWRIAQDTMRAELAKAEAAKQAAAEKAAEEAAEEANNTVTATIATTGTTTETATADLIPEDTEGKAQIIADMKAAESMATTPAVETFVATDEDNTAQNNATASIGFNPNIAIEPAEPDITFGVSYDQQDSSTPTTYTVRSTPAVEQVTTTLADTIEPTTPAQTMQSLRPIESLRPTILPRSVDELVDEANAATIDKNYRLAISNYWQALGSANNRDDIWNLLSRTYLIDGQFKNAETTALEAIRLSPREIKYTLDYLRAAQKSKTPTEFFTELETAYDRFPQSPEVTLSLARGYERIAKNNTSAKILYQRFIDLAPSHPLRPQAESAISRL